jgi:hypothetical protein
MLSFLLTLIAAAAVTLAGREAVRVGRLSAALGAGAGLVTACWLACIASSGLAAWLGSRVGMHLSPAEQAALIAAVLLLTAGQMAWMRPGRAPAEPTRSFGAIAIVLAISQLVAPAGFLVLALGAAARNPVPVAIGGALGSGAILTAAWRAGAQWETRLSVRALRWSVAVVLLLAATTVWLCAPALNG